MALSDKKVVQDTPSEVVENLRKQFNALLEVLQSAADFAAVQTSLNADGAKRITLELTLPALPSAPKTPVA